MYSRSRGGARVQPPFQAAFLLGIAMLNELLTTQEAAPHTGLTAKTLAVYRVTGRGPRFVRVGPRFVRYRLDDLEAWVRSRITEAGGETIQAGT